jgi:magnesium-transporting ATPase (P-type)
MLVFLIIMIQYGKNTSDTASTEQSIPMQFPLVALMVNVILMSIRNIIFENRQVKVSRRINNKLVNALFVSRSRCRFIPMTWEKIKPG